MRLIKKYILKYQQFIKFVLVGIIATLINYLVYLLFIKIVDKNISYTIAYALSFGFNLLASHLFTFREKLSKKSSLFFALAHIFNYLFQLGLLNIVILMKIPTTYAPIPVYIVAVPVNYFTVRYALKRKIE